MAKSSLAIAGIDNVETLVLEGDELYFTDGSSSVRSVTVTNGEVKTLATGQEGPFGLAIDDRYVYWSNQLGAAVKRTLKDGSGSPELVVAAAGPTKIGVFGDSVYWIDTQDDVWKAPKTGGTAIPVSTAHEVYPRSDLPPYVLNSRNIYATPTGIYMSTSYQYYHGSAPGYFSSLTAGWSSNLPDNYYKGGVAVDGYLLVSTNVKSSLLDPDTGAVLSAAAPQYVSDAWLTANSCGMFIQPLEFNRQLRMWSPALGAVGSAQFLVILTNFNITAATSDDENIYFFSEGAINRLPLP